MNIFTEYNTIEFYLFSIDYTIGIRNWLLQKLRTFLNQVQIPPEWMKLPGPVKGIEQEKVDFECLAAGIPHPFYTWVDFEGRDATEKDG